MQKKNKIAKFTLATLLVCLLMATLLVQAKAPETMQNYLLQTGESTQPGQTPNGISTPEWFSIQQQINAGKYRAYANSAGGYNSSNPAHGWQINYSNNGTTTLTPRDKQAPNYHLGMRLKAIGYESLQQLDQPQQISADDSKVTYQWNDTIKEWWINSPNSLEQWFSITQRPPGARNEEPLTLQMTLDSELQASQFENSIHFNHADGTSITYNKLKVWDATGRTLPARLQLVNNILSMIVEDNNAQYPVTIDPSFQQQAYLKASNTGSDDRFGQTVAIDEDTVIIGAPRESSNATGVNASQSDDSAIDAGAAYVFTRIDGVWTQQAYLKASNAEAGDRFGQSVAITGDTVLIGAANEGSNGEQNDNSEQTSGAAYVFTRTTDVWTQQAYLKASNSSNSHGDRFGNSVSISGDTLVIGAFSENSDAIGVNGEQNTESALDAGAAYVYTRNVDTWTQQAYLKASNAESGDHFGISVSIDENTIVVGARDESSNAITINGDQNDNSASQAGAAYIFTRTADTWIQQAYLKASNAEGNDQLGQSVDIAGDTVVVGAHRESSNATEVDGNQSDNSASTAGAAYVFNRSDDIWSQQAYLKASNTSELDFFGWSVAIAGDTVVIGASRENSSATTVNGNQNDFIEASSGAAYVFIRTTDVWSQQDYLKAFNAEGGDRFGFSTAIDSNTIVIGANEESGNAITINGDQNDNSASGAGAAYVFNLPMSPTPTECTLDADGNSTTDALTDGLLFVRYLFGSHDESLILGAVASDCVNCSADELAPILEQCATASTSDIDGNGEVDALTDGLLIIRYLFGSRGDSLIEGAVADNCSRCSVLEVETYMQGLLP